jgi:hypothetical protein
MIQDTEQLLVAAVGHLREEIAQVAGQPLERELRTALALVHAALEELEQARRLEEPAVFARWAAALRQ